MNIREKLRKKQPRLLKMGRRKPSRIKAFGNGDKNADAKESKLSPRSINRILYAITKWDFHAWSGTFSKQQARRWYLRLSLPVDRDGPQIYIA